MSEDSDASQDDMSTSTAPQTPLTLDKELPRRVIVDRGGDYLAAFISAAWAWDLG